VHREPCHRKASARFARDRAHIARILAKAAVKRQRSSKMSSSEFDMSMTRRFDGSVVPRSKGPRRPSRR
jgi:hypothetical protein